MGWKVEFYNTQVSNAIQKWPVRLKAKFTRIVELIEIILSGFIKKTQKTPLKELDLARKRMNEVKNNE